MRQADGEVSIFPSTHVHRLSLLYQHLRAACTAPVGNREHSLTVSRTLVSGQAQQIFFLGFASSAGAAEATAAAGAATGSSFLPNGHSPMPGAILRVRICLQIRLLSRTSS
jgi:hypothetical protein